MRDETRRRNKALQVVRSMDTEALVNMLKVAPAQVLPTPQYDDLMKELSRREERDNADDLSHEKLFGPAQKDPSLQPPDHSPVKVGLRATDVKPHDIETLLAIYSEGQSEKAQQNDDIDYTLLSGKGPQRSPVPKPEDVTSDEHHLPPKLFINSGDEQQDHGDDENWI